MPAAFFFGFGLVAGLVGSFDEVGIFGVGADAVAGAEADALAANF